MRNVELKGLVYKRWTLDYVKDIIKKPLFYKLFPSCSIEIIEGGDTTLNMSFDAGVPKKPVVFCGFVVDLEDGRCYMTREANVDAPLMCKINEVINEVFNVPTTVDAALSFVETIKLSGNVERAFDILKSVSGASIISRTINGNNEVAAKNIESSYNELLEMVNDYEKFFGYLVDEITRLQAENAHLVPDMNKVLKNASTRKGNSRTVAYVKDHYSGKSLSEKFLSSSCEALYTYEVSLTDRKSDLLAMSGLELANALEEGNDTVLVSDLKKKYVQLGFDKLVSGRELGFLVKQKDVINTLRKSVLYKSETTSDYAIPDVGAGSDDMKVIRNSILQLGKIIKKIIDIVGN